MKYQSEVPAWVLYTTEKAVGRPWVILEEGTMIDECMNA